MANEEQDPGMTTIHPRIRYNTIGGVNGPLVILDNVGPSVALQGPWLIDTLGQVPQIQRDRQLDLTRWLREIGAGAGSSRYDTLLPVTRNQNGLILCVVRESSCRPSILPETPCRLPLLLIRIGV